MDARTRRLLEKQQPELLLALIENMEERIEYLTAEARKSEEEKARKAQQTMNVVDDAAAHLGKNGIPADTFQLTENAVKDFNKRVADHRKIVRDPNARLPFDEVKKTLGYAENKAWINKKVQKGYTILDMGDPLNSNATEGLSAFYELEKTIVFGN